MSAYSFRKCSRFCFLKDAIYFRILVSFFIFSLGFFQPLAAIAQNTLQDSSSQGILYTEKESSSSKKTYSQLMREFRVVQIGKENGDTLSDQRIGERTTKLRGDLEAYLADEKKNLGAFSLFDSKKNAYITQLEAQIRALGGTTTLLDKIVSFVEKRVFGIDAPSVKTIIREPTKDDFSVPENPSQFSFPTTDGVDLKRLSDPKSFVKPGTFIPEGLQDLITIEQVEAGERSLPVIEDVTGDEGEIRITQEIQDLAIRLGGNPVSIYNDLSSRLRYEPYYGAKKGAAGCLAEQVCNDIDAASLSIALMRASGIPAHYKKSIIVVTPRNLKDLLGVEDVKVAFATIALKKIPIFTLSGLNEGKPLDEVDLSQEKAFAIEWVYPELYYEYDERGANVSNAFSLEGVTTTPALQEKINQFPKKEWIPFDVIFAPLTHTKGDLVPPQAGFTAESFFSDFLKDTRMISPLDAFSEAVKRLSGRNVLTDSSAHSTRTRAHTAFSILPLSLPYLRGEGRMQNGTEIKMETWSRLPDERKASVTITLIESASKSTVFKKKFFGSSINNTPLSLVWQGASVADQELIDQYGGVHLAPATRVHVVSLLEGGKERHLGTQPVAIGERLITRFSYAVGGQEIGSDEKFSIAGNQEGIFVTLSRTLSDLSHSTVQRILAEGQTGIARSYLLSVQEGSDALAKVYDRAASVDYARAVVTQNRVLSEVNGFPITFDFSGLSIDASMRISDFSARGAYKENQIDFRRLLGLYGSHLERDVFEKITGLSGISTVKGIQLAYQKPETYQVRTIKSANAQEIDALELSENTKRSMRDDVAKGWTVITPNKLVQDGAWKGVVYISLNPDGTGQYAIGEQTGANGGWTTAQLLQYLYVDAQTNERNGFLKVFGDERFYFEDTSVDTVLCRVTDAEYTVVTKAKDWKASYGHPCNIGTVRFSGKEHSFVQASNASKFYRENTYDYWDYKTNVVSAIDAYIREKKGLSLLDDQRLWSGEKFTLRFSRDLGTYLQTICEVKILKSCSEAVVYYVPGKSGATSGGITRVRDTLYARLSQNNNELIKKIGFPTGDDARAAASEDVRGLFEQVGDTKDSLRKYQDFFNGQLYTYFLLNTPKVFYTYGPFTEKHNAEGGTRGKYGFPVKNPEVRGKTVVQLFEHNREFAFNTQDSTLAEKKIKKFACKENPADPMWYETASYFGAELSGLFDASADAIEDSVRGLAQLPWMLTSAVIHFGDTMVAAQELIDELKNVNVGEVLNAAKTLALESTKEALQEFPEVLNKKGCDLRVGYLTGFITGAVIQEVMPSKKLSLPAKLQKLTLGSLKLSSKLKKVSKIGNHGMRVDFKDIQLRKELDALLTETNPNIKGINAEKFVEKILQSSSLEKQRRFPTSFGDRIVDFYDTHDKASHFVANEVKAWKNNVSNSDFIRKQIQKEIELMNVHGKAYRPAWHFLQGEPSKTVLEQLEETGIQYILYSQK